MRFEKRALHCSFGCSIAIVGYKEGAALQLWLFLAIEGYNEGAALQLGL
jgi:hypothetical protein